uniref:Uncharacterized protein n=1 Tax=Arundo donax TaxID=35708 RepID=A0A0A8YM68_ARUDO
MTIKAYGSRKVWLMHCITFDFIVLCFYLMIKDFFCASLCIVVHRLPGREEA